MRIRIGIENNIENRSMAWALEYPGCFAYGNDAAEAIINFPQEFIRYQQWLSEHTPDSWLQSVSDFNVAFEEAFTVYTLDENYNEAKEGYDVNAWFRDDWKPLTRMDIRRGLLLLSYTRQDLLALVKDLTPAQLGQTFTGERWPISGILGHVGGAEWWYMDRLDLAPVTRTEVPKDPFERLTAVRGWLEACLPGLEGKELVMGKQGEFWSPRKLLRRAVWHEADHIHHISRLINENFR